MRISETRYAKAGDAHIAYQVVGDGPINAIWIGTWFGHVEARWEIPEAFRFFRRLSQFARVILFDKRGTGLSDPVALTSLPALEDWMDDVRAVLDAEGWDRAAILTNAEGGALGMLFAATYPERTIALVLSEGYARAKRAPDYPEGGSKEFIDGFIEFTDKLWGTEAYLDLVAPTATAEFKRAWARFMRQSASPGTASAMVRSNMEVDVRHVLDAIRVPTLVMKRKGGIVPEEAVRYLADNIRGARYVELPPGHSLVFLGDPEEYIAEIEEFLTGVRPALTRDRVLATVMFTDLVDSTQRASDAGDVEWRELIHRHDEAIRRELVRYRGREIKTTGDGFLATFDGPARAIGCARSICERIRALDLPIRVGLHTGECEFLDDDVIGIAVNIASRVVSLAGPGDVFVSSTVKDLVAGSRIEFEDQGKHTLRGVQGSWRIFRVIS